MLRIFLILSLAVSLAGVAFSFVLKDNVTRLTTQRDTLIVERDNAVNEATQAKAARKKAEDAEKVAKADLETAQGELAAKTATLNDTTAQLEKTAKDLEATTAARDTAQRELAAWKATGVKVDQINALKGEAARLKEERDAFAEEKRVMGREIARLNEQLDVYRGRITEVIMPDVRAMVTAYDSNHKFVVLDKGGEDGLRTYGKMVLLRGEDLLARVQIVRLEPHFAIANLLSAAPGAEIRNGDRAMTSYEALAK